MAYFDTLSFMKTNNPASFRRLLCGILVVAAVVGLSACGSKEKKSGQALVKVNGEEITALQVNDELSRMSVKPDQQEAATKQLLESIIDRQLLLAEAKRNKIDRTPGVMSAIERAKSQIIVQAYLQSITSKASKPSRAEIDDYFQKHPDFFAQRKRFDMQQLLVATKDFNDKLEQAIDSAKSLDEVAAWMDKQGVRYARGQLSRNATDMPPEMAEKLLAFPQGQLFIIKEGEKTLINTIVDIKDSPVEAKSAAPKIEQYLTNKKIKEIADAELKNLRSSAKIEYLNGNAPPTAPSAVAPEDKQKDAVSDSQVEQGSDALKK